MELVNQVAGDDAQKELAPFSGDGPVASSAASLPLLEQLLTNGHETIVPYRGCLPSSRSEDQLRNLLRRLLLHVRQHLGVGVERDSDVE